MSPDFLAPACEVALDAVVLAPDVAAMVTSLQVTHEPDSLDHFTLSLANPFPDLPFTHGSHASLFQEGSAATVKLGYVDALQQVFDGEITRVAPTFAEEAPTLTVEGHTRLHWLRGATRTRTFQDVTDAEIATQIAGDAGLQAQVDSTPTQHPYLMQVNQTDLEFLLERARRIRYELLVDGKTLHFRKPADGQPESVTLVWGDPQRGWAPEQKTLPLTRFAPTLDATVPATDVTVRGQDPSTRDAISGKGAAGDEVDTSGTTGPAVAKKAFGERGVVVVALPVASQAEADEIAKAILNRSSLGLVTGSGTCIGFPEIRAGTVVSLEGLGDRFSGPYTVTRSTHRFDDRGYETSFSVRRGAVG